MHDEGVIKFTAEHEHRSLPVRRFGDLTCQLAAWREIMAKTGLVGQRGDLYGGAGYGNVSGRIGAPAAARGERAFLITGTQTGGTPCVGIDDFCVVTRYDYQFNRVSSFGAILPSSESMTHGAIYDLSPQIRFVLHGHSPVLWRQAQALRLPTTAAGVAYGTPQMAHEVQRLYQQTALAERRILSMAGHEDGIIVFGKSAEEAGQVLVTELARAYGRECAGQGVGLCSFAR
ncbi:MAG: class II aldolase/adducin family protein [Deltaproteobacteria bacterium]|nr:class II aldolase/adducin family protein [Deltaproteobacteria bacterium]